MFKALEVFSRNNSDLDLEVKLEKIKNLEPADRLRALNDLIELLSIELPEKSILELLNGKEEGEVPKDTKIADILQAQFSKNNTARFGLRELAQFRIKTLGDISKFVPLSAFENINRFGDKVIEAIRINLSEAGLDFAEELDRIEEHRVFALYMSKDTNEENKQAFGVCGLLKIHSLYQLSEISMNDFKNAARAYSTKFGDSGVYSRNSFANTMVDCIKVHMDLLKIEFKAEEEA